MHEAGESQGLCYMPFKGNAGQVLFAHLQQPPVDPRKLVPELPSAVAGSILRALEKKPENRFQSVGAFAAALGTSIAGVP